MLSLFSISKRIAETNSIRSGVCLAGNAEIIAAGAKPEPLVLAGLAAEGSTSMKAWSRFGAKRVARLVASILLPVSVVPANSKIKIFNYGLKKFIIKGRLTIWQCPVIGVVSHQSQEVKEDKECVTIDLG